MATATTTATTSHEEPAFSSARAADYPRPERRRRHSYHHSQHTFPTEQEIQYHVEQFLAELSRRLDFIETYAKGWSLDASVARAYETLTSVRDACTHASDGMLDAGRRRARVFVEAMDAHYNDALRSRSTLEAKAAEGVHLMEALLNDFESRAYAVRDARVKAAGDFIGAAREVVDDSLVKARRAKDVMASKIEQAIAAAKKRGLIHYHELPEPWRVNPYVLRGYRFSETKLECLRSTVGLSNETVNIWSHFLGLLLVLTIALYVFPSTATFSQSSPADIGIAMLFFFAAAKCLVCSTLWHTMASISEQCVMERFACVDYTGISLLVATSIMTTEYTAFYCEPVSRWAYMVATLCLGIAGTILPWHPIFNRADMSWLRVGFFVSLAATGFLPIFQLSWSRGLDWALSFYAPILKSVGVYLGGAILYASKTPERWCPGWFDYVGGSHNIWHFAVLGGIFFHYMAMQEFFHEAFSRRDGQGACGFY